MAPTPLLASLFAVLLALTSSSLAHPHHPRRHHDRAERRAGQEKRAWELQTLAVWVPDGPSDSVPVGTPTFSIPAPAQASASTSAAVGVANALVNPNAASSGAQEQQGQGDVTITQEEWWTVYQNGPEPTGVVAVQSSAAASAAYGGVTAVEVASSASSAPAAQSSAPATAPINGTNGKKVFAHFMVGIVSSYAEQDWVKDMQLAKGYGIDGFALNIGTDPYTDSQLELAYSAAESAGFLVFISFDFNWFHVDQTQPVIDIINKFIDRSAQFRVTDPATNQQAAYVSTFAGDGFDWAAVKSSTGKNLFVVPNWQPTQENANKAGVNGLYSWLAWPSQDNKPIDQPMSTDGDKTYLAVVEPSNKLYMAPVSPWFSTHFGNTVSYAKNWLFKSEALWHTRWEQILAMQSQVEFLEIVTWNDYGESHYVGPVGSPHTDDGSMAYAQDMPHDALLDFAKPYIAAFKTGSSTPVFDQDMLIYWYRPHLKSASCDGTDTCGGKPSGWEMVSDSVFVAAFSKSGGEVKVTSGSNAVNTTTVPAGVTMLELPMGVGQQQFAMTSSGGPALSGTGNISVSADCWNGIYNFNIYSGMLR